MTELRAQGRYGPELHEVLPAMTAFVVVVCALVAGAAVLFREFGAGAPTLTLAVVVTAAAFALLVRRPVARRRRGVYTPRELAELDTPGLVAAVARMLRRDGWYVQPPAEDGRPGLRARDAQGRLLSVAFRPVAEPLPDEEPRTPPPLAGGRPVKLVVHRGAFTERDVQWADRRPDIHLIDGGRLRRWGGGTPLRRITDLDAPRQLPWSSA